VKKLEEIEAGIVEKIECSSFKIKDICYINWGLRPKSSKLVSFSEANNDDIYTLIKGGDIGLGGYDNPAKAVIYNQKYIHPGRMNFPSLLGARRLLVPKVTGEEGIRAAIAPINMYNDDSTSMLVLLVI